MEFRLYQPGDEKGIVHLWNACLAEDRMTLARFRNLVLLDANFDPLLLHLAWDNDQLVGCAYAVRRKLPMYGTELEPEHGWIPFFFVHPEHRRQGIASRLLDTILHSLKDHGRKKVFFASYAPNYIVPGVDRTAYPEGGMFLDSQGFQRQYTAAAMDISLVGFSVPEEIGQLRNEREAEGYRFRPVELGDLYPTIQLANEEFNPDWGRAIREGLLTHLPMDQIMVVEREAQIRGFVMYGGYEGIPERFGPFGVHSEERGKKLGKLLLYQCLEAMKAKGLHTAWFLWTGETSPAGHLYRQVGFEVTRRFDVMVKEL